MKRVLIAIAIVLAALIATIGMLFAPLLIGTNPMPEDMEINGVRFIKDGFVLVNIIDAGEREVVLIDAGMDTSGAPIIDALSQRGLRPEAVKAILITHGHFDHIAAATGVFPNARVMALEEEIDLIKGIRSADRSPIGRVLPVKPTGIEVDRILQDGETVHIGDAAIQIYAIPGHTDGSAAFLVNSVLFLGDAADSTTDGEIKGTAWVISHDVARSNASLANLEQRLVKKSAEVKVIAFSHSGPLIQGLAPLSAFAEANR